MSFGFLEIDHLLGSVADPVVGGEQYERLGFNPTPLSVIEPMGVGNRLVIFNPTTAGTANFIECMGVVHPDRVDPMMQRILAGPPGLRTMVLSTANAYETFDKLKAAGYPYEPPRSLSRQWTLPSGEVLTPAFNVVLPIDRPLGVNFCDYVNISPYMRPEFRVHPNTAQHFSTVFVIAADPQSVAASYAHMFGQPVVESHGNLSVGPGSTKLCVGTARTLTALLPAAYLPSESPNAAYLGFEVEVADLTVCEQILRANAVPYERVAGALVTPAQHGCGNVVRFKQA